MRCEFGDHDVEESLDYLIHERADGKTFTYCISHEPLTDSRKERLIKWAEKTK